MTTPPHQSASSGFPLPTTTVRRPSPSPASSPASASSASIFSAEDALSSQSSAPSSVKSAPQSTWDDDSASESGRPKAYQLSSSSTTSPRLRASNGQSISDPSARPAPELRRHPRRTQSHQHAEHRPPPSLVRQSHRKDNFVESLVDTTVQMIEVIWPLSTVHCDAGKHLITLRLFVQEVLKRSKTSYSTLQVALYYLILVKSCLPNGGAPVDVLDDTHAARAMQCGRRMFLAALILASKYLQDRNYSARAWSKISGLRVAEINSNELAFLAAVRWKLHLPESLFTRWTEVVLQYSLSPRGCPGRRPHEWKTIVAQLTPELGRTELTTSRPAKLPSLVRGPCLYLGTASADVVPPARRTPVAMPPPSLGCHGSTVPAPPTIPQLPTPALTPAPSMASSTFGAPAAGANGASFVRCISGAMREMEKAALHAMTLEPWPTSTPVASLGRCTANGRSSRRRSSVLASHASLSSPASTIAESDAHSSRSSPLASLASSACALQRSTTVAASASRRPTHEMSALCASATKQQAHGIPAPWDADCLQSVPLSFGHPESYLRSGAGDAALRGLTSAPSNPSSQGHVQPSTTAPHDTNLRPRPRLERKRERPLSLVDASDLPLVVSGPPPSTFADTTHRFHMPPITAPPSNRDLVAPDPRLATSFVLCTDGAVAIRASCSLQVSHARKRTKHVDDGHLDSLGGEASGSWAAVN